VPYDQWLVTHVSLSWRTKELKQWLLSKCISTASPPNVEQPTRHRPVSPITFATSSPTDDQNCQRDFDELNDHDRDSVEAVAILNVRKYRNKEQEYLRHALKSSISSTPDDSVHSLSRIREPPLPSQYRLVSFSTGQILEDDLTLSWYKLRPYELLEMHDLSSDMRIPREIMLNYVQPYFEAEIHALRLVRKDEGSHGQESSGRSGRMARFENEWEKEKERKKKRTKLEWRDRWVIIRHGALILCKHRRVRIPLSHHFLSLNLS
jgi:hypothetical protein